MRDPTRSGYAAHTDNRVGERERRGAVRVGSASEECEDESTTEETPQYYEYGENVSRRKR